MSATEEREATDYCPLCGSSSKSLKRPDPIRELGIPGLAATLSGLIVLGIVISLWQRSAVPVIGSLITSSLAGMFYRLGHYRAELVNWRQAHVDHQLTKFEEFIVSKF